MTDNVEDRCNRHARDLREPVQLVDYLESPTASVTLFEIAEPAESPRRALELFFWSDTRYGNATKSQ